jgi:hypothetical protein
MMKGGPIGPPFAFTIRHVFSKSRYSARGEIELARGAFPGEE